MKIEKKIYLIELLLFLLFIINFFIFKTNKTIFLIIQYVIVTVLLVKYFNKKKYRPEVNTKNIFLIIIVGTLAYYVITYLVGFLIGFVYSTYSHSFLGIARNFIYQLIFIYTIETIREKIVKTGKFNKKAVIISILVLTLLELLTQIKLSNINTKYDLLQIILLYLIPFLSKNIFLTYCLIYSSKINCIVYQLIMTIPTFFLPVFTNFGNYLTSIITTVFPILMILLIKKFVLTPNVEIVARDYKKIKITKTILTIVFIVIFTSLVYLVSDFGKYRILAIGSTSMTGTINKGDCVILKKDKKNLKKNNIIVFKENNRVIVHRIIKVIKDNDEVYYQTKGDANKDKDAWIVYEEKIVGKVNFKIKYIGWPTVWLSDFINN